MGVDNARSLRVLGEKGDVGDNVEETATRPV
jgi:hypothetical protein